MECSTCGSSEFITIRRRYFCQDCGLRFELAGSDDRPRDPKFTSQSKPAGGRKFMDISGPAKPKTPIPGSAEPAKKPEPEESPDLGSFSVSEILQSAFDNLRVKKIWLFGFIAALSGGAGFITSFPQLRSKKTGKLSLADLESLRGYLISLDWSTVYTWAGVGIMGLLLYQSLAFFLRGWSQASLIHGINQLEENGVISIKGASNAGWNRLWTVFLMKVLAVLVILAAVLLSFLPLIIFMLADIKGAAYLFSLIGFMLVVPVSLFYVAMAFNYGQCYAVLSGSGARESLRLGFRLIKNSEKKSLLLILSSVAIGITITTLASAIAAASLSRVDWGLNPLSILGIVVALLIALLALTFQTLFSASFWTVAWRKLVGVVYHPEAAKKFYSNPSPKPTKKAPYVIALLSQVVFIAGVGIALIQLKPRVVEFVPEKLKQLDIDKVFTKYNDERFYDNDPGNDRISN